MRSSLATRCPGSVTRRRCMHPTPSGAGFFREHPVPAPSRVAASPVGRNVTAMVETRIADYMRHFERAEHRRFDVWHAQDGISANALATLKERGLIAGFARTVHHVDRFRGSAARGSAGAGDRVGRSSVRRQPPVARLACARTSAAARSGRQRRRYRPLFAGAGRNRCRPADELEPAGAAIWCFLPSAASRSARTRSKILEAFRAASTPVIHRRAS